MGLSGCAKVERQLTQTVPACVYPPESVRLRRNISIWVVLWRAVADYSLCCPRTVCSHATVLNSQMLRDRRWAHFLIKWPWTGCCLYNVQKQEAQRNSSSLLGLSALFKCKRPGSMHRYITLAQGWARSQASTSMFCSEEGRSVQSIAWLKQRLENCLFPEKRCSEWRPLFRKINHGISSLWLQECARCQSR